MMNYQDALNVAIETLEYIKKNNPAYFNDDKDYIAKTQLALSDIKDNCTVNKKLSINQYNI